MPLGLDASHGTSISSIRESQKNVQQHKMLIKSHLQVMVEIQCSVWRHNGRELNLGARLIRYPKSLLLEIQNKEPLKRNREKQFCIMKESVGLKLLRY